MKLCIYGAASNEIHEEYIKALEEMGETFGKRGHSLVFGGGASGLMGAAARGFHRGGGQIFGVAPSFFNVDGVLFPHCTELFYTETMGERKAKMEDLADAFLIAPGGIGTFEEFFEALTLKQLGRHNKPIVILNLRGYFDPLLQMMDAAVAEGFFRRANLSLFRVCTTGEEALSYVENYDEAPCEVSFYRGITK